MHTIFALATPKGRAGVGVIRVSGPAAEDAIVALTHKPAPQPRTAVLRELMDGSGKILDSGLVLWFPGPSSFTGENTVEFQIHGSVAVIDAVERFLAQLPDLRRAEPGEFTCRALANGRLDLTQVEGLSDLLDAQTEVQRMQAMATMSGRLSDEVATLRTPLVRAAALLEAVIDFADEDIPQDVSTEVLQLIGTARTKLQRLTQGQEFSERIRTGFEVAIVGPPNVGKSTLLNALSGRDAAITSEYAGTTRDVIEVQMDLDGIPVTVLDTAGLRETSDPVEKIGIERAKNRAESADIRVFLVADGADPMLPVRKEDLVLRSKTDLSSGTGPGVSGKTGEGIDDLVKHVAKVLRGRVDKASLATHDRHVDALNDALVFLTNSVEEIRRRPDEYDIAAEEVRSAIRRMDSLIGKVDVESLLDEIFSSFCIGK